MSTPGSRHGQPPPFRCSSYPYTSFNARAAFARITSWPSRYHAHMAEHSIAYTPFSCDHP